MAHLTIPKIELNSNAWMPQVGYGTWLSDKGKVGEAVKSAIRCGYRHIDCAFIYGNQREIGQAMTEIINKDGITRNDLFITSKIWNTFHSYENAQRNIDMILNELNLEYLDLCLIHWPMGYKEGDELFPKNEDATRVLLSDIHFLQTWKALEEAVYKQKIRSIGVSNFNKEQIQLIWENCKIKPSVLQVEIHPYFQQEDLVKFCKNLGICVTAYSPLGSSNLNPFKKTDYPSIYTDPIIIEIARKYNKTNAQIALRYQIQRGICIIPKSMDVKRMTENIQLFNFNIQSEDMCSLAGLETHRRITHLPLSCDSPLYPWSA